MAEIITIVSGLPRSGTSMMMSMLEKGGMEVLTDNIRKADEDNPKGYFEFEKVKKIKEDSSWLEETRGKVFKMVSMLLYDLPSFYKYKIIFMKRDMAEMLASQRKMLEREGKEGNADDGIGELFAKHLKHITGWLELRPNISVLYINYRDIIDDPHRQAKMLNQFLDNRLNVERMITVIDKSLYRNKANPDT